MAVAPLTLDEFLNINPANPPPPPVLDLILRYRSFVESRMPHFTQMVIERASALAAKGMNIPARFLPATVDPTARKDELLQAVVQLYRKMLTERYVA